MRGFVTASLALLGLALATLSVSCADEAEEREALLRNLLFEDNRILLEREPALVAGKYRKMATSPYLFLRGTASLFWHDAMEPTSPGWLPTGYGNRHASRVLITGDPHPENFGSYLSGNGEMLLDFNDFDSASYGPWHLELRRLALGWFVAGRMLEEDADARERMRFRLPDATIRGYLHEIESQVAGAPPVRVREDENAGVIVDDLFRRAIRDGDIKEELDDFTRVNEAGDRVMFFGRVSRGEREGVFGSELVRVPPDEEAMVHEIVRRWRRTLVNADQWPDEAFRVKGVARRLGAGVGSYAILRYYVLLEGPTEAIEDDWVIDIKEAIEATQLPGVELFPRSSWTSPAHRVVDLARRFQEFPDNDPLVGWADLGDLSFHVQDRIKYQKNLDVERFIDRRQRTSGNRFTDDDLLEVAFLTGRILARGHARADTLSGTPGLAAISAAIDGDSTGVWDETMIFVLRYGPQIWSDFALFRRMLETYGPLLGHRPTPGPR